MLLTVSMTAGARATGAVQNQIFQITSPHRFYSTELSNSTENYGRRCLTPLKSASFWSKSSNYR